MSYTPETGNIEVRFHALKTCDIFSSSSFSLSSQDILNHIVSDIEIFMGKVATVVAKNSKKKKKKKGKGNSRQTYMEGHYIENVISRDGLIIYTLFFSHGRDALYRRI